MIPKEELNGLAFVLGTRLTGEIEKMSLELEGIGVDTIVSDIVGGGVKFYVLHGVVKHPITGQQKEFSAKLPSALALMNVDGTIKKLSDEIRKGFYS
jgi:hypothetical protein